MLRIPRFLALVLTLLVSGGHAGLIQMTAWTSMLERHLATEGMGAALTDTFDGKHPCALCCAAHALAQQQDPAAPTPARNLAPVLPQAIVMDRVALDPPASTVRRCEPTAPTALGDGMQPSPPVPPPRRLM